MKESTKYYWLDLIRGLSALAVFTGHLRIIFFQDTPTYQLNVLGKAIFFLTGFGHISVTLFFVLSGFLIINSIHQSVIKERWTFSNYATNRLTRLWIVLIPCLVLGLIWDKVGLKYWGDSYFYGNHWKYFLNQDLASKLTPTIFFGNVFFLMKTLVPTLGSNGSLWSLANEFWYYLLFPLFYFACFNYYKLITRAIFTVAGILILVFVGTDISVSFLIWLMGGLSYVLLRYLKPGFLERKLYLITFTLLFLLDICMVRSKLYPEVCNDFSIGVVFALLIPFLTKQAMSSSLLRGISTYLSDISYTLYLAHLPIIYCLTSIVSWQNMEWNTKNFLFYLIITIIVFLYSRLIWYLFERNTSKIKAWIITKKQP